MGHLVDRAVTGLLLAFAAVTTVGVAILLVGGVVPDWLLPAALLIGLVVPRRVEFGVLTTKANRWLLVAVGLVLLVVFAALVYGALATPSRHWDGAIAWDLKAIALAEHPTLNQPLFQNPYVHHHSRDYPLFQPLLVALTERCLGFGRIVFPVCWAMALGAVGLMLRRRGASLSAVGIGMVAFACTPFLVSPTSGSVDSGYADATLAAWLTIAAAGCVLRDTRWIVCSVILVVLTKPEGLVYAGLLLGAAWLQGCRSVLRAAALGSVVGTVLLLLLQHELQFVDRAEPPLTAILIPIAVIGMMVLVDGWMDRRNLNAWRLRLAGILCIIGICVMPLLVQASGNPSGSLAHYMKDPWLVWQRLELLPAVVLSLLDCSLLHGWFGVTAPLVLLAAWQARRSKESGSSLGTWLVLCLPCWCAVFLVSNIELEHHLRSRMPRLLLHATGIAWVYILATWQTRSREEHSVQGDRAGDLLPH